MNRGQASDRIIKAALPMGPKLVLLVYLMHQSSKDSPETGVSWPGLPALALHLQMSRSFVIEARKALVDARILVADGSGKGESPRYRIDFARVPVPTEEECAAYKDNIREHRSPKGVQRVNPRGPAPTPPGVQDVDPRGSSVDTPRGPDGTPQGSTSWTRTVSKEPPVVEPSPGNHHQENRPQGTGGAEVSATVTDSPPPAEPSGSPADLWSRAADLAEGAGLAEMETPADPEAWRASKEFQLSTNAYVFDDADPVGASEQPSDPRQIESPATERNAPNAQFGPVAHPQTPTTTTSQRNAQPSDTHPHRAPEAPPQDLRPSPTHPPGNGEGAPGGATGSQDAPSLFGRTDTVPEAQTPAKAPPRARKAQPPPVDLTSPDDPCPLLLGAKVSIDSLTEDIVAVYRSWWRRQLSPATCRLTIGRLSLIRQALGTYTAEQLVHLVRYAYEAADLGNYARAWRGESGQVPPDLEMLIRGDKVARNVEMSARWSVERVQGAPPAGPLPENVHPFPMPPRAPFRKATTAELMQALANM